MTVVEFFDKDAIENVISSLLCNPDKVVFIGHNRNAMNKAVNKYRSIALKHGKNVEFYIYSFDRMNLQGIMNVISKVLEEDGEITIDLTGGEDLYLVAAGIVYNKHPEKVRLHRFNIEEDQLIDCDADGNVISRSADTITIEENMKIYNGRVVYDDEISIGTHKWDFNDNFRKDIETMWEICRENPSEWNKIMKPLNSDDKEDGDNRVYVNSSKETCTAIPPIFRDLNNSGLIRNMRLRNGQLSFDCKNEQMKSCLTMAGRILELKTTTMLLSLNEEVNGELFDDILTGVTIYWDESNKIQTNVTNEVDVVAMKGLVPVFISCKNGTVEVDELYKLSTVAERFGGKYARKVLIATAKVPTLSNRAEEMNIKLIDDVGHFSPQDKKLKRKLRSVFN